ncbi:MAG: hypothetical protein HY423_07720 [Candidatus Lambdaproteobacteria bacterium]|nr:hypothetical protein [Candidatus Lambdaproteobacteria bacterium]
MWPSGERLGLTPRWVYRIVGGVFAFGFIVAGIHGFSVNADEMLRGFGLPAGLSGALAFLLALVGFASAYWWIYSNGRRVGRIRSRNPDTD